MFWARLCLMLAASYERAQAWWQARLQAYRLGWFYWLLARLESRSMVQLQSGQWMECRPGFAADQVAWIYDGERHLLYRPGEQVAGRGQRWPWLGAVEDREGGRDLSPFFAELRLSQGPAPPVTTALALFAHQKGWMPRGELAVTLRTGDEMVFDAVSGSVVEADGGSDSEESVGVDHVNHIQ